MYCIVFDLDHWSKAGARDDRFDAFLFSPDHVDAHTSACQTVIGDSDCPRRRSVVHMDSGCINTRHVVAGLCSAFGLDRNALAIFSKMPFVLESTIPTPTSRSTSREESLSKHVDAVLVDDDPITNASVHRSRSRFPFICSRTKVLTYVRFSGGDLSRQK